MEKLNDGQIKTGPMYRFFQVDRAAINDAARTVSLAFSSEAPYERYYGTEILDHGAASVRLDRLKNGGAVLLNHDTECHVGVVEQVAIGPDRVGRAVVRFGKIGDADEAFKDVQDGIKRHVSVGYFVHSMVLESTQNGDETYRVMDWEPFEISLVPIPADPTVGIGRAAHPEVTTTVVRAAKLDAPKPIIEVTVPITTPEKTAMEKDTVTAEQQDAARRAAIVAIGESYKQFVTDKDVLNFVMNGKSRDAFVEFVMEKMQSRHTDTSAAHIGMTSKEVKRYSLTRAICAAISGDWSQAGFEREAGKAVEKMLGKSPEGFYVPNEAFARDFNVVTTTEAAGLIATDLRTDLYVDVLRNNLVLAPLGIRILSGLTSNIAIPKKATTSAISRVTEIAALTEVNPTIAQVTMTPKRFGGFVEYSKQTLIQASLAVEAMLRDDLLQSAAVDIQDQVINGSGAGANMRGIRNTSGIGSVVGGANGLAIAWSHIVGLESACTSVNAEPDKVSGYLINTKSRGTAKTTQKAANLQFLWDNGDMPLNSYRAAVSNSVPSNLTKGTSVGVCSSVIFGADWSMSVLGLFGAPDITVDPFSLATTGQVRITLNQYADHGVRLPAVFASMEDALTP